MAKSSITISFNSIPLVGQEIILANSLSAVAIKETFATARTSNYKTEIGDTVALCANLYYNALLADYNSSGLYDIFLLFNSVVINAKQSNVVFSTTSNTTGTAVDISIINETETLPINITDVSYSQADSDFCNYVKVNVTTDVLATEYSVIDSVWIPNTLNPFEFTTLKGSTVNLVVKDSLGGTSQQTLSPPGILSVSDISISLYSTPTGANANIIVSKSGIDSATLQYSLDNINWQSYNYFTGLLEGSYTIYVKDLYGCVVSKGFDITVFTPNIDTFNPFTYLSKEMSIRFKQNIEWDNFVNYKNEDNTLSCEENVKLSYPFYHLFQTSDVIKTQFLSNYANISVNIINDDGSLDSVDIVKRSNNLGATDMRDAFRYNAGSNQTGIYFSGGKTYDYNTGLENGDSTLNGTLPNYAVIGNYINLNTLGWFEIIDIAYNENYDSEVIIIDLPFLLSAEPIIVSSLYNRTNYDVYEFEINFFDYKDSVIQIEILQNDDDFGDYNYLSERIKVAENWDDTIEIIWYNVDDTFVFYSTGLRNKARLYFDSFSASDDSEVEIHKTDISTLLIRSESYETMELELGQISTGIKRQLTKAFLHKELFIDGIQYVSKSIPESENIKFTNQYTMKANLIKTGNVYNSEWDGQGNAIEGAELIALLKNENKYIKLQ